MSNEITKAMNIPIWTNLTRGYFFDIGPAESIINQISPYTKMR